jgi:hypothetical protein
MYNSAPKMSIRDFKIGLAPYFIAPLAAIVIEYARISLEEAIRTLADQYDPTISTPFDTIGRAPSGHWWIFGSNWWLVSLESLIDLADPSKHMGLQLRDISAKENDDLRAAVQKNVNVIIYGAT